MCFCISALVSSLCLAAHKVQGHCSALACLGMYVDAVAWVVHLCARSHALLVYVQSCAASARSHPLPRSGCARRVRHVLLVRFGIPALHCKLHPGSTNALLLSNSTIELLLKQDLQPCWPVQSSHGHGGLHACLVLSADCHQPCEGQHVGSNVFLGLLCYVCIPLHAQLGLCHSQRLCKGCSRHLTPWGVRQSAACYACT
jgi:hypothetical protein